jgi:hypothetical protein
MEAASASETSVSFCKTGRLNPEDRLFHFGVSLLEWGRLLRLYRRVHERFCLCLPLLFALPNSCEVRRMIYTSGWRCAWGTQSNSFILNPDRGKEEYFTHFPSNFDMAWEVIPLFSPVLLNGLLKLHFLSFGRFASDRVKGFRSWH